ncbi:N-acetylmuramoyl-L-alanine amidase [Synergistales bacterium]|nr:N-acetylmuramoyl-L-alanine amidase [Synergistales bacterium]
MKKNLILIPLLAVIICGVLSGMAYADMYLMEGEIRKGKISFMERDGVKFAALDQMLTSLGIAVTPATGGLMAVYSGKKIEFWSGSNIVRANAQVYPLSNAVFSKNGHWWGEPDGSLRIIGEYLASVKRPSNLRWASVGDYPAAPNPPAIKTTAQASAPVMTSKGARILKIRWGEQKNAYRAVVEISAQTGVRLEERLIDGQGRLEVAFDGAVVSQFEASSPWKPLAAEARPSDGGAVLSFTHAASRVDVFWLDKPWRYVIDFYFGGGKNAQSTPPKNLNGGKTADKAPAVINTAPQPTTPVRSAKKKYLVVVDAGHGGHDPGAVGNGLKEKDINLRAAIELTESVRRLGMEAKLTRADDRYLKLGERTAIANDAKADVFISMHCNALPKGLHASGAELYLMDQPTDRAAFNLAVLENKEIDDGADSSNGNDAQNAAADKRTQLLMKILIDMQQNDKLSQSTSLAEFIYNRENAVGLSFKKVRQAPLFVLRGAEMPSLLVEMAYISEAKDAKLLASQAYRKRMADAIAAGILDYLNSNYSEGGGNK